MIRGRNRLPEVIEYRRYALEVGDTLGDIPVLEPMPEQLVSPTIELDDDEWEPDIVPARRDRISLVSHWELRAAWNVARLPP